MSSHRGHSLDLGLLIVRVLHTEREIRHLLNCSLKMMDPTPGNCMVEMTGAGVEKGRGVETAGRDKSTDRNMRTENNRQQ